MTQAFAEKSGQQMKKRLIATTVGVLGCTVFMTVASGTSAGVGININELAGSLAATGGVSSGSAATVALPLFGAHHRPLMLQKGLDTEKCAWATADVGIYTGSENGTLLSQEVGACKDFPQNNLRAGFGIGHSMLNRDTVLNGNLDMHGGYVLGEVDYKAPSSSVIFSATGLFGLWNADIDRGYTAFAATSRSSGDTNVSNAALKLMVDWRDAWNAGGVSLSPKAAFAIAHTHTGGYTETGGTAPATFNSRNVISTQIRLGVEAEKKLSEKTVLTGTVEAVHRFDDGGSGVSGTVPVAFPATFSVSGQDITNNWLRLGVDVDHEIKEGMVFGGTLFGATNGQDPDLSGALSLKFAF